MPDFHYVRVDADANPVSLYRAVEKGGRVDKWDGSNWNVTAYSRAELDGLGGESRFYPVDPGNVKLWQDALPT